LFCELIEFVSAVIEILSLKNPIVPLSLSVSVGFQCEGGAGFMPILLSRGVTALKRRSKLRQLHLSLLLQPISATAAKRGKNI